MRHKRSTPTQTTFSIQGIKLSTIHVTNATVIMWWSITNVSRRPCLIYLPVLPDTPFKVILCWLYDDLHFQSNKSLQRLLFSWLPWWTALGGIHQGFSARSPLMVTFCWSHSPTRELRYISRYSIQDTGILNFPDPSTITIWYSKSGGCIRGGLKKIFSYQLNMNVWIW